MELLIPTDKISNRYLGYDFHDVNRVPPNGFIIIPLSISRLHTGQCPKNIYQFLKFFKSKFEEESVDIVFLYTNGLYFNSEEKSSIVRHKTTSKMLTHKQELMKLVRNDKNFIPKGIHYLTWDYLILNTPNYLELLTLLKQTFNKNIIFRKSLDFENSHRLEFTNSYDFVIEETLITYIIRQKLIELPHTLSLADGWRLMAYTGRCLISDVFIHQHNILPKNNSILNKDYFSQLASHGMYDMEKNVLVDYEKIDVTTFLKNEMQQPHLV